MIARRTLLASALALVAAPAYSAQSLKPAKIYTLEGCPCCKGWITHMRRAGYAPTLEVVHDVVALSTKRGVKPEFSSCHMAVIDSYVVLGHVPPADVDRLLREKPKAIGLSVPGMPLGSPGMENAQGVRDRYETLLLLPDGKTKVFAKHT